jgi:predicted metal-dependent phosphoesterase TrpH
MPQHQPFTSLCRAISANPSGGRADLHVHTTHSDGAYTPAEVVDLAKRSGLAAVAITDHDTLSGIAAARAVVRPGPEVIAGVEISAESGGIEVHVLGYFFRPDDAALNANLERLRARRAERFREMIERLRKIGVWLDPAEIPQETETLALGRRHLADLLVKARRAGSVREAFARYLHDGGQAVVPKRRLSAREAIALVRGAGGVASWAHPSYDGARVLLEDLQSLGLQAVEVDFPGCKPGRTRHLRAWAAELGLAVTGGSDCHGPGPYRQAVGARGVTANELDMLRRLASR